MTSILQFSDIHFGVEDREAMAAVKDYSDSLAPDVVVICGDITQDGKTSEFKSARDWIARFSAPKVITPGNHDIPVYGVFQRLFDPFGRYNKYIAPLSDGVYIDESVAIFPYNTSRGIQAKLDWSLGVVDVADLKRVTDAFSYLPPRVLKLLAVHHPLIYPPNTPLSGDTKNGHAAMDMLGTADIGGILSGHVHTPFVIERTPKKSEILSIGSGTLSTRIRGKPASFNHVEVSKDDVKVTAIDWINGHFVRQETWRKERAPLQKTGP